MEKLKEEFVDLTDTFMPPDESAAVRKRIDYNKLRFAYNHKLISKYQIPKGSNSNSDDSILKASTDESSMESKLDALA